MDLKSGVLDLVNTVFKDTYGYEPENVRSLGGDPPSKKNSYLFNAAMLTYQGLLTANSGDMVFFIYFDPESKAWEYNFESV
jgi:hypothetical protein